MTRPGIEPRSPGPLANTLTAKPMDRFQVLLPNSNYSSAVIQFQETILNNNHNQLFSHNHMISRIRRQQQRFGNGYIVPSN